MISLYDKQQSAWVNIYNVRDDKNGYPHFLIYENDQWKYKSAKHFADYEAYEPCNKEV